MGDSIFYTQLTQPVPSSLVELMPILGAATEVDRSNPRVAYLCRLYVSHYADRLDPTSSGPGVRQFKTALMQTLEIEKRGINKSDAREIVAFYLHYCKKFIKTLQNAVYKADRYLLNKSYQTEAVLFEVLKALNAAHTIEVDHAVLEMHSKIEEKRQLYAPDIMPPPLSRSKMASWDSISDGEGSNGSSTSDDKGLIDAFRDR